MLSEPVMMLEMMVTTVEARVKFTFTRFTSSFTFVTTLDTWGRGGGEGGGEERGSGEGRRRR